MFLFNYFFFFWKIIGLAQPIHSTEKIQSRAFLLEKFGRIITIDQTEIHDKLVAVVDAAVSFI